MGYFEQNIKTIDEAFTKLLATGDARIRSGMEEILDLGVTFCLSNHDQLHSHHKHMKEGYGWVLLHNGVEVSRWVMNGIGEPGNADAALNRVAARSVNNSDDVPSGWVGYVLAGLEPATYFNVMYEFIPMRQAIRDIRSYGDFENIFKPVSAL